MALDVNTIINEARDFAQKSFDDASTLLNDAALSAQNKSGASPPDAPGGSATSNSSLQFDGGAGGVPTPPTISINSSVSSGSLDQGDPDFEETPSSTKSPQMPNAPQPATIDENTPDFLEPLDTSDAVEQIGEPDLTPVLTPHPQKPAWEQLNATEIEGMEPVKPESIAPIEAQEPEYENVDLNGINRSLEPFGLSGIDKPLFEETFARRVHDHLQDFGLPSVSDPNFEDIVVERIDRSLRELEEFDTSSLFEGDPPGPFSEESPSAPNISTEFTVPAKPEIVFPEAPEIYDAADLPELPEVELPKDSLAPNPRDLEKADLKELDDWNSFERKIEEGARELQEELRGAVTELTNQFIETYAPGFSERYELAATELEKIIPVEESQLPASYVHRAYEVIREGIEQEKAATLAKLDQDLGARGFPIPPGFLNGAIAQIEASAIQSSANAVAKALSEAEKLSQQRWQFAVEAFQKSRDETMNHIFRFIEQDLGVRKEARENSREIARIAIQYQELLHARLKAQADFYRLQMEDWNFRVENAYKEFRKIKEILELEKVKAELSQQQIQGYEARLQAEGLKLQLYDSELKGALAGLDVEKTKVSLYDAQVSAFRTKAEAKELEFRGYEAALRGNESKVNAYNAQVNAYTARAGYLESQAKISLEEARAKAQANKDKADVYSAKVQAVVEGYLARAKYLELKERSSLERVRAQSSLNKDKASLYASEVQAASSGYGALAQFHETDVRAGIEEIRAKAEINRSKSQDYAAKIRAEEARITEESRSFDNSLRFREALLNGHQEALKAKAALNQDKGNTYAAEARAALEEVRAKTASFEGKARYHEARVRAETDIQANKVRYNDAKAGNYDAKVRAQADIARVNAANYSANAQYYETKARVLSEEYRARAAANRGRADVYTAKVQAAAAKARAEGDKIRAEASAASAQASAYSSQTDAARANASLEIERARGLVETSRHNAELKLKEYDTQLEGAKFRLEKFTERQRLQVEASIKAGDILGNIAAQALSSQNSMVQLYTET